MNILQEEAMGPVIGNNGIVNPHNALATNPASFQG